MGEWRASSSSSRYIYWSYKRGKRSAHLRVGACVASYLECWI